MHRHTAGPRSSTKFLHRPTRSLRRTISLLSMFPAVAGVQPETSRSIKPRERDLGDLRLFVLVRILTRPTNHPRHAACASNYESKPVRPHFFGGRKIPETPLNRKPARRSRKEISCAGNQADARVADAGAESVRQLGCRRSFELRFLFRCLAAFRFFLSKILARLPVSGLPDCEPASSSFRYRSADSSGSGPRNFPILICCASSKRAAASWTTQAGSTS